MKLRKINNKKGQFESMLYVVVTIVVVGITLFFFQHLFDQIYTSFDEYFNESTDYNDSEAHQTIKSIQEVDRAAWDWAFFAIFIGLMIQMVLFSFATRINIAFYWIFALLGIIILIAGTILSNIWQELAANPEFAVTITRFPITNSLLGTYYPIAIVTILLIGMIILFGKPPQQT